jgi:DNA-binding NtrC family response regulator
MSTPRLLVVEDDKNVRAALRTFLTSHDWEVMEAEDCRAARERFAQGDIDAVVTDFSLPDGDALELLPVFKTPGGGVPVVVLTGQGTIDRAVSTLQLGADHFLTKPTELAALETLLRRAFDRERDRKRALARNVGRPAFVPDPFTGRSQQIRRLEAEARTVLASDSPVLILGETGSGKGVLASWLHRNGKRAEEAYVDLNCAGLSREFLESELFGHEKGSFTGAVAAKPGMFEVAHRGTIFLDEIGDTPGDVQAKLLKVIEERRYRRLGGVRDQFVDARILTATHHDLPERARKGEFRSDLYFRIAALPLVVPPLRERPEDIPPLAGVQLEAIGRDLGRPGLELTPEAQQCLATHDWPGNVRELRNVLERAALLSRETVIGPDALRFQPGGDGTNGAMATADLTMTLEQVQKRHIERVLADEKGHVERTAHRLGVPRSSLYEIIRRLGIRRVELHS